MSGSSMEKIKHKLESIQEALQNSPPRFPSNEPTPRRQLYLPVNTSSLRPETETDIKLKTMKQTNILTIDGRQYVTDFKDMEHLCDLGSGTCGNVVKMRHGPSKTIMAVKQMRRTSNSEANKRILMDLDVVLKSYDCQYIVRCLGCFVRDPDVWICMELMSMCFDKLLKLSKTPVPENILGKLTVATVRALSYLKEKHGVIHRDVKPSNILIDEWGNIKLCDFSISGNLVDSKANTRSAGCAAYMAPERIDPKKPKYDIRADVWSLGITLVELATARSPYEGCNTDFEVLTKVLECDPPNLPHEDGGTFSEEFRDFVNKCLTKDCGMRPKYLELLEQPFIKKYEVAEVNVSQWFKNVVETSGIKTHNRTIMPISLESTTIGKLHKINNTQNTGSTATIRTITQIPSYQQQTTTHHQSLHHPQQTTTNNSSSLTISTVAAASAAVNQKRDEQKQSQLPQPISTFYGGGNSNSSTVYHHHQNNYQQHQYQHQHQPHLQTERQQMISGNGTITHHGGSGSSSGASSSSPQSPPSLTSTSEEGNNGGIVGETTNKLYRKSPFMQRKPSNGSAYKFGGDSPKKESVLSSIGQSIIRNLTSSPFSQKKHSSTSIATYTSAIMQPQQIDSMWRLPSASFDVSDAKSSNPYVTGSPVTLGRKKFQSLEAEQQQQQQQQIPSLIPVNRNETSSQRVPGNHSPIVLQRFYHQQNQLREREIERQQMHQHYSKPSPIGGHYSAQQTATNPLLSNYLQTTNTTNNLGNSIIGGSGGNVGSGNGSGSGSGCASSSHSTSSQSSSQSSTSQIAVYQQRTATPTPTTPPTPTKQPNQGNPLIPSVTESIPVTTFGNNSPTIDQLQYQPLPQHFIPSNTFRSSRSPTTPPDRIYGDEANGAVENIGGSNSKLAKLYNRRQLQQSLNNSQSQIPAINGNGTTGISLNNSGRSRSVDVTSGGTTSTHHAASKENNFRHDHGWFTAMKRQFASYVKLHLNSAASTSVVGTNGGPTSPHTDNTGRSLLPPYYRSMSAATAETGNLDSSNLCGSATAGSFLRRYAAGSGSSAGSMIGGGGGSHLYAAALDRRHRSPDPPPRYNRGQSPLLLRKNVLELSGVGQGPGQLHGSPLLNRRFVNASPPLPPPRRGSESVPGSPQHFRTRIHFTPEPQRRIYRTIDQ